MIQVAELQTEKQTEHHKLFGLKANVRVIQAFIHLTKLSFSNTREKVVSICMFLKTV